MWWLADILLTSDTTRQWRIKSKEGLALVVQGFANRVVQAAPTAEAQDRLVPQKQTQSEIRCSLDTDQETVSFHQEGDQDEL